MEIKVLLIIGSGVFGSSTALFLIRSVPNCHVLLDDWQLYSNQSAPSYDANRIIRTEYEDLIYLELALRAREIWTSDPLYSKFFHACEQVSLEDSDTAHTIFQHFRRLGVEREPRMMSVNEMRSRHPNFFDGMALEGLEEVYVNPNSGWVEATPALEMVIKTAVSEGVKAMQATVTNLTFDDLGNCTGAQTDDGQTLSASHTILATGA